MPYIATPERKLLDGHINELDKLIASPGQLNYAITRLCLGFLRFGISYAGIALITGVLTNVKDELYRRRFGPYEDEKRTKNGDVEEMEHESGT